MVARPDDFQPDDEEVAGGAVKSFLEHLEDLRWVLIKSAAATLLAMAICLIPQNTRRLVAILDWPRLHAAQRHILFFPDETNQTAILRIGSAEFGPIDLKTNRLGTLDLGTNHHITIDLVPTLIQGQQVLSPRVVPAVGDPAASGPRLSFYDPSGPFFSAIHMAFYAGLICAAPFVLYFIGEFLMPALKIREKKYFLQAFAIGLFLFFAGVTFAYFAVMPAAIKFAQQYANYLGVDIPFWKFEDYMGFEVKLMLGMGLGFELPVVLLALVKIGLLDYEKLSAMRRYMIVINLVLGALLTTNEIITQIIMAVIMQFLFEVSVWIAWYWERQEKKRQEQS